MNWRLGLDLGTNSIGWSVFSLTEEKEIDTLVDLGVRIFSDGRDPKSKEPLAVERRIARGQRKLIYRRKLRRKATFRLLQKSGLFPNDKAKAKDIKSLNPYELRVKALIWDVSFLIFLYCVVLRVIEKTVREKKLKIRNQKVQN